MLGLTAPSSRAAEPPAPHQRLQELDDKLEAGTISTDETRELLRALTRQALRSQPAEAPVAVGLGDKVIAVYHDRNTTKLVIEARQPFVAGIPVFVGPQETEVVLQDLLSRSKNLYYYAASAPGRVPVDEGDAVFTQKTRVLETPSPLMLKIKEVYTFEQKARGEVTAVQDGRAMIDRGTLHEVRERDIYRVLDASGNRKGYLEIRGIGDLQSSGVLYDRMEDRHRRVLTTEPGDRVVFMGQRKLFGFGGAVGWSLRGHEEYGIREKGTSYGGVWNLMFKNGWGFEVFLGTLQRTLKAGQQISIPILGRTDIFRQSVDFQVDYQAPIALKKNFFFPSVASPYVILGGGYYHAVLKKVEFVDDFPVFYTREWGQSSSGVFPLLGTGVEFFPARLIRPRFDFRWLGGRTLHAGDKSLSTEAFMAYIGLFSAW
ncbi:MAG: hypothetical protein HY928_07710 [Elusimicrobia bacterium]|nr:hypothetical protein [Elusimicrobiota bacterium]